jgi:hypothetical protein
LISQNTTPSRSSSPARRKTSPSLVNITAIEIAAPTTGRTVGAR